jgi:hypothetical protein
MRQPTGLACEEVSGEEEGGPAGEGRRHGEASAGGEEGDAAGEDRRRRGGLKVPRRVQEGTCTSGLAYE